jgi:hypothetical protein
VSATLQAWERKTKKGIFFNEGEKIKKFSNPRFFGKKILVNQLYHSLALIIYK